MNNYILSFITWFPALGAILILALMKKDQSNWIKRFATAWFALDFILSLWLLTYDRGVGGNAVEEGELEGAESQGGEHGRFEPLDPGRDGHPQVGPHLVVDALRCRGSLPDLGGGRVEARGDGDLGGIDRRLAQGTEPSWCGRDAENSGCLGNRRDSGQGVDDLVDLGPLCGNQFLGRGRKQLFQGFGLASSISIGSFSAA